MCCQDGLRVQGVPFFHDRKCGCQITAADSTDSVTEEKHDSRQQREQSRLYIHTQVVIVSGDEMREKVDEHQSRFQYGPFEVESPAVEGCLPRDIIGDRVGIGIIILIRQIGTGRKEMGTFGDE